MHECLVQYCCWLCFLDAGETITINKVDANGFFIYPRLAVTCEHPRDNMYWPIPLPIPPFPDDSAQPTHCPTFCLMLLLALTIVTVISWF